MCLVSFRALTHQADRAVNEHPSDYAVCALQYSSWSLSALVSSAWCVKAPKQQQKYKLSLHFFTKYWLSSNSAMGHEINLHYLHYT